jgi:Cu+-exporting ATPase
MEVIEKVSQSYLTQLWTNDIFTKKDKYSIKSLTDSISKKFTLIVLIIAFMAGIYWVLTDVSLVVNVVTAVLIVACPCALALSAPFALGNMLRIFGSKKFYLKNVNIIEDLSKIDTIIFDKTGTLTTNKTNIIYQGIPLKKKEKQMICDLLRESNHPLSRMLYEHLALLNKNAVTNFKEVFGKGLQGKINGTAIKLGSEKFVNNSASNNRRTAIYVKLNDEFKGSFKFENIYRPGMTEVVDKLSKNYNVGVLSGDNEGEKINLEKILPKHEWMVFDQSPKSKLQYIEKKQQEGFNILMMGDGLNDAGALTQSNVGIAVAENNNIFTPACDGIMDASVFKEFPMFLKLSQLTVNIIKISFLLSFLYNVIGMLFAVTGNLSPIVVAILMPLSSISIVLFVTLATNYVARKNKII